VAPRGAHVVDRTTPKALHLAAVSVWEGLSDSDPVRSFLYLDAERRIIAGGPLLPPVGGRRAQNWVDALYRYEEFWRTWSRTPRENTRDRTQLPAVERRLGEWARYQRRHRDGLCLYQRVRCEVSPAFVWDLQEHAWLAKRSRCVQFLEDTGRLPHLNSADRDEFLLARWLGRQMHEYQTDTLPDGRRALLRDLLIRTQIGLIDARPTKTRVIDKP